MTFCHFYAFAAIIKCWHWSDVTHMRALCSWMRIQMRVLKDRQSEYCSSCSSIIIIKSSFCRKIKYLWQNDFDVNVLQNEFQWYWQQKQQTKSNTNEAQMAFFQWIWIFEYKFIIFKSSVNICIWTGSISADDLKWNLYKQRHIW